MLSAGLCIRLLTVPAQVQVVYVNEASREGQRPEYAIKPPVADAPGSPTTAYQPRPAGAKYLQLRDEVLRFGVDSLPHVTSASPPVNPPVERMLGPARRHAGRQPKIPLGTPAFSGRRLMIRSCSALLLVIAGPVAAQEPVIPVRKMTITPAAAPVPALRYQLLPELRDTTPGNAALLYYRAFARIGHQAFAGTRVFKRKSTTPSTSRRPK